MNTKEILFELLSKTAIGGEGDLVPHIAEKLADFSEVEVLRDGGIVGTIKGSSDYTILIEAHYDQIGFVVTEVTEDGFVKLSAVGGVDERILPSSRIKILGEKEFRAVFTSVPPHLKKNEKGAPSLSDIYADTGIRTGLKDLVSVGDFAVFTYPPINLADDYVTSPSVDNRSGCAALFFIAEALKGKEIYPTVKLLFADKEELGMRGSVTGAYSISPDIAIAIDVSFGDCPGISPTDTCLVRGGGMIGISPSLTKSLSKALAKTAENCSDCQFEIMGGRTGTDIDAMSTVKSGSLSGLVSIPIRNMHTSAETVSISDIESVGKIISEYILSFGKEA